jgi:S-adenosylmethionine hydrolase
MPVITLTTEWRHDDFYFGIIRGKLSKLCPGAEVVVNAACVPPFNLAHASFVVRNTYPNYPSGTIHIICVHSEEYGSNGHLAVRSGDHYFIGTNNGIFNLILNAEPDEIVRLSYPDVTDELEIFSRAAAEICSGKDLSQIGEPIKSVSEKLPLRATIDKDVIIGSVIFIDSYGNAISNITREIFYRVFENRSFRILVQSNRNHTVKISNKYSDVPVGELLTRFNQLGLLEIAVNGANVSELFSIDIGSVVRVDAVNKSGKPLIINS